MSNVLEVLPDDRYFLALIHVHCAEELLSQWLCRVSVHHVQEIPLTRRVAEFPVMRHVSLERLTAQTKHRDGEVGSLPYCLLVPSQQVIDHVDIWAYEADYPFVGPHICLVVDRDRRVFYQFDLPLEGFLQSYFKAGVLGCGILLFIAEAVILWKYVQLPELKLNISLLFFKPKGVELHVFAEANISEKVLLVEFVKCTEDLFHSYVFVKHRVEVTVDDEDDTSPLHVVMTKHFVYLSFFPEWSPHFLFLLWLWLHLAFMEQFRSRGINLTNHFWEWLIGSLNWNNAWANFSP